MKRKSFSVLYSDILYFSKILQTTCFHYGKAQLNLLGMLGTELSTPDTQMNKAWFLMSGIWLTAKSSTQILIFLHTEFQKVLFSESLYEDLSFKTIS